MIASGREEAGMGSYCLKDTEFPFVVMENSWKQG